MNIVFIMKSARNTVLHFQAVSIFISLHLISFCEPIKERRQHTAYTEYNTPIDYEPHVPDYRFSYDVTALHTGDIKSQHESRDGDSVYGYYSLMEPGGTLREVRYTADGYHGFRATVKRYRHGIQIE